MFHNKKAKVFILLFLFASFFYLKLFNTIKVCLCTIGKKENLYAREYVQHYINKGVDKIFIYDNNDKNGENFETVLYDFIYKGFVEIINFRGVLSPQIKAYRNCYKKNYKNYDFLLFYDMDEFLFLRNFPNIKSFLNQNIFQKCQKIQLNWFTHTDNNKLFYENRSLSERFPEKEKKWRKIKIGGTDIVKSILRGNITTNINDVHLLNNRLIGCDGFGRIKNNKVMFQTNSDHYYNYIDHYWSKSTEEFVNKLIRGGGVHGQDTDFKKRRIDLYFLQNQITLNKIKYIEKKTKFNLSKYRKILVIQKMKKKICRTNIIK